MTASSNVHEAFNFSEFLDQGYLDIGVFAVEVLVVYKLSFNANQSVKRWMSFSVLHFQFNLEKSAAIATEMIKLAWSRNVVSYETVGRCLTKFRAKNFPLENDKHL